MDVKDAKYILQSIVPLLPVLFRGQTLGPWGHSAHWWLSAWLGGGEGAMLRFAR